MWGEAKLAERRIPVATDPPPISHDTTWAAPGRQRRRVRRSASRCSATRPPPGYGVHRDRDTPAAQLAIGISDAARRPVHVTNVAVVGAESPDLPEQVERLGARRARARRS